MRGAVLAIAIPGESAKDDEHQKVLHAAIPLLARPACQPSPASSSAESVCRGGQRQCGELQHERARYPGGRLLDPVRSPGITDRQKPCSGPGSPDGAAGLSGLCDRHAGLRARLPALHASPGAPVSGPCCLAREASEPRSQGFFPCAQGSPGCAQGDLACVRGSLPRERKVPRLARRARNVARKPFRLARKPKSPDAGVRRLVRKVVRVTRKARKLAR